jgi:cellulose synthase operon protein C
MLSQGVIYRHLAHLAHVHPEFEGGDPFGDPVIFYLERCTAVDPEHIPSVLELIERYREELRPKDWHRLVDEAIQRFPDDSQVLLQATESAVARKAYKKAAGFARRLLKINAINPGVRRQMIELQVAHARKQMRSKRPELAAKELSAAAEWERSDAPSALLRIARGLAGLQTGAREQAEAWLREGVGLAGGEAARLVPGAVRSRADETHRRRCRVAAQGTGPRMRGAAYERGGHANRLDAWPAGGP